MRRIFSTTIIAVTTSLTSAVFAADTMGMKGPAPMATSMGYQFELAGPIQSAAGKSIVSVRIIHTADKKPVIGAIIIQSRADMGPIGMAAMNAPIKALSVTTPGVYPFEIQNGSVWKRADKWSLTFSAKVQGEMATIHGSIITELKP